MISVSSVMKNLSFLIVLFFVFFRGHSSLSYGSLRYVVLLSVLGLPGCLSPTYTQAPVEQRDLPILEDRTTHYHTVKNYHTVKKGETLYRIAARYGIDDYKQLAEWNGIEPPFRISTGERLCIFTDFPSPIAAGSGQSKPGQLKTQRAPGGTGAKGPRKTAISQKPLPPSGPSPKETVPKKTPPPKSTASSGKSDTAGKKSSATQHASSSKGKTSKKRGGTGTWYWPSRGEVVHNFAQSGNRGLEISDRFGASIYAVANGRVVYTGSGLRGYGKLIIIKHDAQHLSAYGNNDRMLVREGDKVKRGQKIAEMGKDSTNRAILHFEIRKGGKPVNPLRYLGP
uniref:Lipoprotein NlpD n=1 Tax=Candidatus Kentrum sp. FM TaxID=2126340 RepID=A0A450TSK7_9GAMM|nr:MAG: lipoprotein NlpD [Candidatus Kentron sp. FM]VFJ73369.1 MAG: lipoprotein NlpD [Candidatus Kentron sp. FM]VFK18526.1 MAG: lipoprotein NlpD [Candidatus Kentron sp. FM]